MAEIEGDVLIQSEQPDGSFRCHAYSGIPVARRCWIVLMSTGSGAGRALVGELEKEFAATLLGSSPAAVISDLSCAVDPPDMRAGACPDRRKILALIATEDAPLQDVAWYRNWQSDDDDAAVMTILPPVAFEKLVSPAIAGNPGHLLRRVNGSFWKTRISETLPGVLSRAGITAAQARVFISYRRVETLPLALQLFDALTHEGFEVFLDRFSIPPGYDFQRRLDQELADKSMMLLLESKHIGVSQWTQHEIDFARRNRLGMMTLTMPRIAEKEQLASITFDARMKLAESDFAGVPKSVPDPDRSGAPSDQWPELNKDVLERAVSAVKSAHAAALFRRRHRLRIDLIAALHDEKVDATYSAAGPMRVKVGSAEHLLWLATRPPDTEDFRSLYTAHFAGTPLAESRAIVVGPQAALEPDRKQLLSWLCQVSTCLSFDEGDLPALARRVAKGNWI